MTLFGQSRRSLGNVEQKTRGSNCFPHPTPTVIQEYCFLGLQMPFQFFLLPNFIEDHVYVASLLSFMGIQPEPYSCGWICMCRSIQGIQNFHALPTTKPFLLILSHIHASGKRNVNLRRGSNRGGLLATHPHPAKGVAEQRHQLERNFLSSCGGITETLSFRQEGCVSQSRHTPNMLDNVLIPSSQNIISSLSIFFFSFPGK